MTEAEAIDKIYEVCQSDDIEADHYEADRILLSFLADRGYDRLCLAWKSVKKWYA